MHVTMREVALRAGVSPRTVSNVVNDFALVAPETRARVRQAIEELGYRPNPIAKSLRSGRSGFIMLALPELSISYFAELSSLVIAEARRCSYTVIIEQTDGDPERERQLIERDARNPFVDGLLFSPLALNADQLRASSAEVPIVLLGEHGAVGIHDHVGIDNVGAARAAVEHLIELGRLRIAAIGHQDAASNETSQFRSQGYREALEAAGRRVEPDLLASAPSYHRDDGASAMARLLDLADPPDAVFCYNDLLAIGAMRTLAERGRSVPEDVAVIGFDDSEEGRYRSPSLSTIAPDKRAIAAAAMARLVGRMNGDDSPPASQAVPFRLEARESTLSVARTASF
ncbi:MAG: hypothetical protein JWM85_1377 [Acidimicrobiaceae bacterium]|nr:hypothetical protein [Acidimicrobiaceae bacterium]